MNQIGLFFYIEEKVCMKTYELQEGRQQGIFLIPPEGHDRIWRELYKDGDKNYDFWARGRVAYNTNSKRYNIYHDACMTQSQLNEVREAFGIDEKKVRYLEDAYYTCHVCSKKFDDDDLYDSF